MPSKEQMDFESCVSGAASKILLCRFAWPYDGGGSLLAAITRSSLRRSRCQAHHCGALVGPLASVAKVAALAVGNCIVQKTPRLQRPIERAAIRGPSALAGCASPSRIGRRALFVRFRGHLALHAGSAAAAQKGHWQSIADGDPRRSRLLVLISHAEKKIQYLIGSGSADSATRAATRMTTR
jgi:hypothetical protein